ncbi:MAG: DUF695 domain-containing protein [Cyclobacteriaceae bacterium]
MKEYRVVVPEENHQILEFIQDDLPGFATINVGLREFEPKEVFAWHCSIMLQLEDTVEDGLPSADEMQIIEEFGDWLDLEIKGDIPIKPNALFLARVTWNETQELIWRVFNPDKTDIFLRKLIRDEDYDRSFDYRIDLDKEWKLTEWYLKKY